MMTDRQTNIPSSTTISTNMNLSPHNPSPKSTSTITTTNHNSNHNNHNSGLRARMLYHDASHYAHMRQMDQQLEMEYELQRLERDIQGLDRQRIQKVNSIDMFQTRVTTLQQQNRNGNGNENGNQMVHSMIDREIQDICSGIHNYNLCRQKEFQKCRWCKKLFIAELLPDHERECAQSRTITLSNLSSSSSLLSKSGSSLERVVFTNPQPPRNVHVKNVGHNYIEFGWDPPILDGGTPISNYQISYSYCPSSLPSSSLLSSSPSKITTTTATKTTVSKKERRNKKTSSSSSSSLHHKTVDGARWCRIDPVPHSGFTLHDLTASTEYIRVRVRCYNQMGWSRFTTCLPSIVTQEPTTPSPPLFFRVTDITSSEISFSWKHSLDNGGVDLLEYELNYMEVSPKDQQTVDEIPKHHKVPASFTSTKLTHLRGGTLYKSFAFCVTNAAGFKSPTIHHSNIETHIPSRLYRIEKEIERVKSSQDEFVDTDFLQGTVQREERMDYLKRLMQEMELLQKGAVTTKQEEDTPLNIRSMTNCEESHPSSSILSTTGEKKDHLQPISRSSELEHRKKQFHFRISALQNELSKHQQSIHDINTKRSFLTNQMGHTQEKLTRLSSELDRVSLHEGSQICSNAIHGSNQRFITVELRKELQEALQQGHAQIATWKAEIIQGETQKKGLSITLQRLQDRIQERQNALIVFEHRTKRIQNIQNIISQQTPVQMLKYYFDRLMQYKSTRVRARNILNGMLRGRLQKLYRAALRKWKDMLTMEDGLFQPNENVSIGDVMLNETEQLCDKNLKFNSSILVHMAKVNPACSELFSKVDLTVEEKVAIIQGEEHFKTNEFEQALSCFEHIIHMKPMIDGDDDSNILLHAIIHGKIGTTLEKMKKWENSILHFERQIQLGKVCNSTSIMAQSYLGMGNSYFGRGDYNQAQDLFLKALTFSSMLPEHNELYCQIYLSLEQCYQKMNMNVHAQESRGKYEQIIHHTKDKISSGLNKVTKLKQRLINITANVGKVIRVENVTPRFIQLKAEHKQAENEIVVTTSQLSKQTDELGKSKRLLESIEHELQETLHSTKGKKKSALIHENVQEFETGELIIRLKEKLKYVKEVVDEHEKEKSQIMTKIKNLDDELLSIKSDMKVENGPLMQRILKNRRIRCIGLNTSNTKANDVTGASSFGVEYFVLIDNKSIHIHDVQTGELRMVFGGSQTSKEIGGVTGHTCLITCIYFHGLHIYTGSMDNKVMCWDIEQMKRVYVARGHRASVTCIFVDEVKMVTGSADKQIGLWNKDTGSLIRFVSGHISGILCIESGPDWCVSGGSDGDIIIWSNSGLEQDPLMKNFKQKKRLKGLLAMITVIKYGNLEVVSGDSMGIVTVWWIETGKMLQQCKAHEGKVCDLQFDATKIISCGMDTNIQIIDVMSGSILITLRGHEGPVIGIAFDNKQILSASRDGTVRLWQYGKFTEEKEERFHTCIKDDNAMSICEKYNISISDLLRWNELKDINSIHIGKNLLVRKSKAGKHKEGGTRKKQMKQGETKFISVGSHKGTDGDQEVLSLMNSLISNNAPGSLASRIGHSS